MSFSSDTFGPEPGNDLPGPAAPRRRGRPLEMTREQVLEVIRDLGRRQQLFRVHRDQPGLYARARRLFGSWSAAVLAAGFDYHDAIEHARRRSMETRRRLRDPETGIAG